jgi:hypothetical protein
MRLSTASAHLYHSNVSESLNGIIMYMYLKLPMLKSKKSKKLKDQNQDKELKGLIVVINSLRHYDFDYKQARASPSKHDSG